MVRLCALSLVVLFFTPNLAVAKQERPLDRGIYDALPLKERELHLVEKAGEYEALFLRRSIRYPSPELETFLATIGSDLAPEPLDPYIHYRFFLLRDPQPRTLALPDGQVYVSTGMLAVLESKAQLAALLGHEIAHIAGHHPVLAYRKARKKGAGQLALSAVTMSMTVGPVTFSFNAEAELVRRSLESYSPALEREADERGQRFVLAAGYDPSEMARLYDLLNLEVVAEEPLERTNWSPHPDLAGRAAAAAARADEMVADGTYLELGAEGFTARTRSVVLETIDAFLCRRLPHHAARLARRLVNGDDPDAAAQSAMGDVSLALARGDDASGGVVVGQHLSSAREAYERALELDPGFARAYRGLGYVAAHEGDSRTAARWLVSYLRMTPEAPDKRLVVERLKEIKKELEQKGEDDEEK